MHEVGEGERVQANMAKDEQDASQRAAEQQHQNHSGDDNMQHCVLQCNICIFIRTRNSTLISMNIMASSLTDGALERPPAWVSLDCEGEVDDDWGHDVRATDEGVVLGVGEDVDARAYATVCSLHRRHEA